MKIIKVILSSALCFLCVSLAIHAEEMHKAPSFEVTTFDGQHLNNNSYKNQVLLINIWASWCEPCRNELPAIQAFLKNHKNQGFKVLTVSMDDKEDLEKAKQILSTYDFDNAWITESNIRNFGRIWRIPLTFVIDKNGFLIKNGWYEDSNNGLNLDMLNHTVLPLLNN